MKEHIYILDDHPMIAEGTAQLLMTDERYQVTIGKHYSELYNFIESSPLANVCKIRENKNKENPCNY